MSNQSGDSQNARQATETSLFLSVAEVAARTGLSTMTVYRRLRSGEWPSGRSGRKHLIPREFVDGLIAEMKAGAGQINFEEYSSRAWRAEARGAAEIPAVQMSAFLRALDAEIKSGRPLDVDTFAATWFAKASEGAA